MPVYMMQLAYTSEAWSALVKAPEDRAKVARSLAESLGGQSLGFWLSLGDYDVVALFDLPDQSSVAALGMAVAAGGAIRDAKTTPLMSTDDALEGDGEGPGRGVPTAGGHVVGAHLLVAAKQHLTDRWQVNL